MFKKIRLPIISVDLLKKGKNNKGYDIFSKLISSNFSKSVIWSKKFIPAMIGQ